MKTVEDEENRFQVQIETKDTYRPIKHSPLMVTAPWSSKVTGIPFNSLVQGSSRVRRNFSKMIID